MKNIDLFSPVQLGPYQLKNRIVMAPMTRSRANTDGIPSELSKIYYEQRASAGLIISEGIYTSSHGKGYARTPGVHTAEQVKAWRGITDVVHAKGGFIFAQLMHVGRIAHPLNKDPKSETVAPSAIQAKGEIYTDQMGLQEMVVPRALETAEITAIIDEFKQAAMNALEAGFDGVELHGATGYLLSQFLSSNTNHRTDQYGGSVANRIRFIVELLDAVIKVDGADKVGIRFWPGAGFNDIADENSLETHKELLKAINPMRLAYVHIVNSPDKNIDAYKLVRDNFEGISIINGGFGFSSGQVAIQSGRGDLVSYGSLYLANPDLVERFRIGAPLNTPDPNTFYSEGERGCIDYPFLLEY